MRRRKRPTRPEKIGRAVHANAGIEAAYRKKMRSLINEMSRSYVYWIKACYRQHEPKMAMDATPAVQLQRTMSQLGRYWLKRFREASPKLAAHFAKSVSKQSDAALRKILKDAGFSVEFKITPELRDVMTASINENVSLIKSIQQQYHTQIEGSVMRSVQIGRDLDGLTKELQRHHHVSFDRAKFIARDQNNKATAALQKARQTDLGLKQGIWLHSHAGKVPRKTHLANHGHRFNIAEGWFDPDPKVRKHIMPGELVNCRCVWRVVIPGLT